MLDLKDCQSPILIAIPRRGLLRVRMRLLRVLTALMVIATPSVTGTPHNDIIDMGAFAFMCEMDLPIGRSRLHGLMISDGLR